MTERNRVVTLNGDVDLANSDQIEHGVDQILSVGKIDSLVLDLGAVDFIDSTGLRMLWGVRQKAQDAQAKLVLRRPSASVLKLLRLTGMHRIFQIEEAD